MLKEKLDIIKRKTEEKDGNNKKKIENLVIFVIVLIITIVAINYILSDNKKEEKIDTENNKKLAVNKNENIENINNEKEIANENIEERLENILSNIKGVGKSKVLLTYSRTNQIVPMYDEDSSKSITEEKDSGGGSRIVNESNIKKDIIYKESNGIKTPITQSIINPKIEGAIITAEGAYDENIKTNIIQAVEAVTGLATYKIQVFEMKEGI